jgi:hypothetical protein
VNLQPGFQFQVTPLAGSCPYPLALVQRRDGGRVLTAVAIEQDECIPWSHAQGPGDMLARARLQFKRRIFPQYLAGMDPGYAHDCQAYRPRLL